jgi:hypothetical protein
MVRIHPAVLNPRIYTTPDGDIPVYVSAFGPQAVDVGARYGDGWMTTSPDAELLSRYRSQGGSGPALGAVKVCWAEDEREARKLAYELWPTSGIPGQLHQDLPTPAHVEQAASMVSEDAANKGTPCGPDPDAYAAAVAEYVDAGFDEVALTQIGPDQEGFFASTSRSCGTGSRPERAPSSHRRQPSGLVAGEGEVVGAGTWAGSPAPSDLPPSVPLCLGPRRQARARHGLGRGCHELDVVAVEVLEGGQDREPVVERGRRLHTARYESLVCVEAGEPRRVAADQQERTDGVDRHRGDRSRRSWPRRPDALAAATR